MEMSLQFTGRTHILFCKLRANKIKEHNGLERKQPGFILLQALLSGNEMGKKKTAAYF
jgi:hypothetical protein